MRIYTADECARELFKKEKILILVHSNPDGDCIGSGLSLAYMLDNLGKNVKVLCPHVFPERLRFMSEDVKDELLCFGTDAPEDFDDAYIVSTDVASPELLGRFKEVYADKINMCIDHHMINTVNCDAMLRHSDAAACGELILEIGDALSAVCRKTLVDKAVANMLYAAISSDCGSFKYGNTTAKTLLCASRLKSIGADSERISKLLFDTKSLASFRLTGLVIPKTELLCDGRLTYCLLLDDELESVGATKEDCDGITQIFREISGVEMSIFAKQYTDKITGENCIKMSLRSNNASCAAVCESFGGGGHLKAAGCTIRGMDCDSARQLIVERAIKEISVIDTEC